MNKKLQISKYIIFDYLAALVAWALFFLFRKLVVEYHIPDNSILLLINTSRFFEGIILVPVFWVTLYYISGYYRFIFRKNIPADLLQTFIISLIGVIVLFFTLLLDDVVKNYHTYYITGSVLLCLQFILTVIPRLILTNITIHRVHKKKIFFNTLIIGCGKEAVEIYIELQQKQPTDGNHFIGYIKNPSAHNYELDSGLSCLGGLEDLPEAINKNKIDEIIIAISSEEQNDITEIISWLGFPEITVKAIPGLHNVLRGKVKITNIMGTPLLEIAHEILPHWQLAMKMFIDFAFAFFAVILFSPLYLICSICVKFTSKGPVLFRQERVGKNGKPFYILKFRSMYIDAEKNGPNLSCQDDKRITTFGRFLRKTKIDETPNFINVLKGEMSLVGPRPERQFYIDQIIKLKPQYLQLQKIKPGITSLGQVKFGYAENVEQMTKRLRYDMLYMENMSIYTDLAIIYYTIILLFKGRHV
jgi:exopolysaccharide biosynthesis polyprenyl glycosylphosphotransferase